MQFHSWASRAKPPTQAQWKLPTVFLQVPCVQRPGNTLHSFTSEVQGHQTTLTSPSSGSIHQALPGFLVPHLTHIPFSPNTPPISRLLPMPCPSPSFQGPDPFPNRTFIERSARQEVPAGKAQPPRAQAGELQRLGIRAGLTLGSPRGPEGAAADVHPVLARQGDPTLILIPSQETWFQSHICTGGQSLRPHPCHTVPAAGQACRSVTPIGNILLDVVRSRARVERGDFLQALSGRVLCVLFCSTVLSPSIHIFFT